MSESADSAEAPRSRANVVHHASLSRNPYQASIMESARTAREAEQKKAEELQAQIAALQAQLSTVDPSVLAETKKPTKRKEPEDKVLAPATPSPSA